MVQATEFTTGTGTYTLSSVGIFIPFSSLVGTPAVKIYGDTGGNPGTTLLATMTNPGTFTDNAVHTFTAPANTTLSASTTYWVVTSNSAATNGQGFQVGTIANTNLDSGTAAGWSIGAARLKNNIADTSWTPSSRRIRFAIRGTGGTTTNNPPTVATAIPDQSATAGTAFSYVFPANTFSDADTGDTLSYTATKADDTALPTWLAFAADTRTFSGTPQAADAGTVAVEVTASDGNGGSVSDAFDITVIISVPSEWSLKPTGLTNGDKFRLLFLSSTKSAGSSTDIATYNTFVQGLAAAGHTDIRAYSAGFRVVGCTAAVDARDNTATTYTATDKGVPVYWLNGAKAADEYEDFYDGSWDDEANDKNESGTNGLDTSLSDNYPITGCNHDGTESFTGSTSLALGANRVRSGGLNSSVSDVGPLHHENSAIPTTGEATRPMYGLSAVFEVAADTTPPTLTSADVEITDALIINLVFSEDLQLSNPPALSAFTVTVDGSAATVSSVGVPGSVLPQNELWLQLSTAIRQRQAVVVTYTDATSGDDTAAIQDTAGNDAATFTTGMDGVPAVTNNSTVTNTVPADWSLIPTGLSTGDKFRLLFLSSTKRNSESTDIADYNTFIQTRAAAGHTDIQDYSADFRAVGCTADTDARDNTKTTYTTTDKGVPIYWLNGAKAADQYEDFYDGSWDDEANDKNESGTNGLDTSQNVNYPWTGCDHDGTEAVTGGDSFALGTGLVDARVGRPNSSVSGHGPLNGQTNRSDFNHNPLYGLSEVFQVAAAVVVTNNPPTVANAIPDQSATAGTAFSYVFPANTFSDADTGDTLSYTATKTDDTALPTWLAFAAGTRTFSGTPQAADIGTVAVKVTASDGNGGSVSDTFDITVAADPNAHCNALDTSELWCGTLTVGVLHVAYGYNAAHSYGSVAPLTFTHGGATITVNGLLYVGTRLQFSMSSALGAGDFSLEIGTGGAKRSFAMNNPGIEPDFFNHGLSWSANETVPVKLLLVNTPATGAPAITGTAQVGQTLTATVGDIADVDGLPDPFLTDANTSFQWIRVATDNSETDIGAMAGAYTLVADDQGTTIKVKVSFTGNNGFAETLTSAATAAVSAVVPSNWSLKPTAVAAGAKFRLLFLSSTKRNASSTDIADYNTFIQTRAAAGHTDIRTYSAGFRAVGCTSDVDARDNTRTTGTGVPIYWLNGAKAADNYADFYDGSWDDEVNDKNESGTNGPDTSQSVNRPFTGCEHNGTEALDGSISQGFGAAGGTKVGRPNSSSALHGPLSSNAVTGTANTRPLYGLSGVFQVATAVVVNNPPAFSADTAARSVAENTAAGQNVGAALTATDLDGHTLIYTLEGADAASFGILSASGQIQTRTGVTYNHEAKSTYTVIVKADDGNGGTATVTVTITVTDVNEPPGRPAAPSVTATAGSSTSLDVSWTAPTNTGPAIASYDLQYREGTSGSFTAGPQDETGTSAAIASLMASTSHQVQVRATNAEGDGDWSFAGTGRTGNHAPVFSADTAARSVAENTAAGQNVGAVLTATDADSDTLIYTLEGTDAASFGILSASGQIQTRTGVTYNHEAKSTYTVIVKADDSNGGTDTVTVTITVTDVNEPPGRPAAPSVTATAGSSTSLDVSWTAPTNTGPAIASYDLQYREGTSGSFTAGPQDETGTSAAIASLMASTSHQVQVRATNAEGDGDWSFAGTGRTGNNPPAFSADTAARSVAENTAAGQNVGAALTATDADSDTLTYTLEGTDAASFDIVSGSGQIRTRTGVTYNHEAKSTHTVVVKADDGNGGTDTVTVTITVTDVDEPPGRPAAPTVSATAGSTTSLDVTWTAPTNTGPAIASYDLQYRAGTSGNFTNGPQNVTGTSAAIGSLAADTSYEVQVRATNAEGDGDWSVAGTGRTTATSAPGAPTGLTATASGTTAINLSWSAPGSTGGSAITGYKIEVSPNGTSGWTDQVANTNSTATTYAHTGLAAGDTRHYRVSAINANGAGTASNVDSATTGTSVPGAPTGLTATASGATQIDLSWTAPASTGGSAITGYKIEVSPNGTSGWTDQVANTNSTATTYAHTGLGGGTTRHYRVSAINTNGAGTASNVDSATTGATAPGAPTGLTATASGTTAIDLSWSAPGSTGGSAITGYRIEVSSNGTSSWTNLVANTNSTATTYAHTGLASGDTRHYRVSAINANGTGTASNVANATTGQTTVPPTLTSATVFEGGVFINLQFSENMLQSNLPSTDTFTVTAAGSAVTVYTVQPAVFPAAPPNVLWILVRPTIQQGQVVVVTYTDPTAGDDANAIQNTAGNDAATFTTGMDGVPAVTNNSITNTPATGAPTITGTATVGQTLTAVTTAIMDADGLTSVSYTYQWIRVDGTDADISGATSITYTLVGADLGKTIKVTVSFTDDASNPETLTSTATAAVAAAANTPATGAPTITGTAQVGQTLTAGTTAIMDADGLNSVNYMYQWIRVDGTDADISGATSITYTLVGADLGKTIKVTVSFTDDASNDETLTSAATAAVSAAPNTPATGAPTITGTAQVGQTLTAGTTAIMDADGLTSVSYTYQWIRVDGTDADISGATSITYTLVGADLGKTIKVTVSFTDDASNDETLTSAATAAVSAAPNTPATGAPTITGTAQVGQTLTAGTTAIMDADGLTSVSYTYQWIRVATDNTETNISGATASTHTLVAADQGKTIKVKVSFTDDASNPETLTSTATAAVAAAANTPATGAPAITGAAQVGQTLTAGTTAIMDANGLTSVSYTYQWIRVATDNTETNIASATASTYTLVAADQGTTIKVTVSFTDDASNAETLTSAATAAVAAAVPNNPPAFSADTAARSVAENTAAGQNVGAALTATDADSDTLTYTLEGTDAASFDIVSGSGQIRTRTGVTYNHEAKSTHTVVVKADDGNGGTDTVTVTITVTDVDEPPGRPAAPSVSATAGSTTSLDVTWTAPTNTGPAIANYDLHLPRSTSSGPFHQRPAERHRRQRRHREPGPGTRRTRCRCAPPTPRATATGRSRGPGRPPAPPCPALRPGSRPRPAGPPRSTSPGAPRRAPAAPPSPATTSRSRPTAPPAGPTRSPTPTAPPPPTPTPGLPPATPATTASPPSTPTAPAPPPTSTAPPPSRSLPPSAMWSRCRSPAPPTRCKSPGPLPTTPASPPSPVTTSATETMSIGRPCGRTPPAPPSSLPT